ncbi:hypothetical protein [Leeuwenhoekiella blandensis]|uniref:Uncharacterized protein n=1 Tax=Leeuwenhoekiella blandensis (strain CECT 7118 / CCUG 51940 / KCTC 22103 / MED217) TaxID=398720 RepID=A3XH78_LEEBM|nr:hypothetical protein [Leeuwenhoekiella blandensis]EAQ51366.1 hypothetical protein MED217_17525 [Leeuwenhoekiella blandensis MED217]
MKTINLVIGAALLATFANCKNEESKEAQVEEQQKVKTVDSTAAEKARYADAALTPAKPVMPENYEIDWEGVEADEELKMDFDNWVAYRTFSESLSKLELKEVPEEEITDYITQLEEESTSLENTIPERLLTEEVMEDIKDIREEVADLRRVTEQPGVDESKIGNQVEELVEAYQDLNEELKETMTKKGSTLLDDNQ